MKKNELKNFKGGLSRNEMRSIKGSVNTGPRGAGFGGGENSNCPSTTCNSSAECVSLGGGNGCGCRTIGGDLGTVGFCTTHG